MRRTVCAVDFTTDCLYVMVRRPNGTTAATEAQLPAEAIDDGRILQPVAVQLFLKRLFKDLGVRSAEIRISLSDSACITRYLDYPKMPLRDLERSLQFEAARELPVNPHSAYIGWQIVEELADKRKIMLVAAWRDVVEGYLQAVEGLGKVTVVEPRSLAIARAVGLANSVLVEWADARLQVAQVEDRRVTYTTGVVLANGSASSSARLTRVVASLLPKTNGHSQTEPKHLVLLGKLYGRDDIAGAIQDQSASNMDALTQWRPTEPYAEFANSCQVANIGALMRDANG
jgi:hypothetical protein